MEDYKDKSLEKLLSKDELMVLFEMMKLPGWGVLKKVNNLIKNDWLEQTASLDIAGKTDTEVMNIVRDRHGQIKGVTLFLNYLESKNKKSMNTKVVQ